MLIKGTLYVLYIDWDRDNSTILCKSNIHDGFLRNPFLSQHLQHITLIHHLRLAQAGFSFQTAYTCALVMLPFHWNKAYDTMYF